MSDFDLYTTHSITFITKTCHIIRALPLMIFITESPVYDYPTSDNPCMTESTSMPSSDATVVHPRTTVTEEVITSQPNSEPGDTSDGIQLDTCKY